MKYNPKNERIKHQYLAHLKNAKGRGQHTLDMAAKALHRYESYTRLRDFRLFHIDQATGFKNHLMEQRTVRTCKPLSKATAHSILNCLKKFYLWLADQPGYRSRLVKTDFDYFGLSRKDVRIATTSLARRAPTVDQVKQVILNMPAETEIQLRDRAVIAFTLLTAARVGAIVSMKVKHVDLANNRVNQDAREVDTKFSKSFTTFLVPIDDEIRGILVDWINYLRQVKRWIDDDPLFPQSRVARGKSLKFEATGFDRKHWRTTTPIRDIFKKAFQSAGLEYYHPHSLRHTMVAWLKTLNPTIEAVQALGQNLGHETLATTLLTYGKVSTERQGEIMHGLKPRGSNSGKLADAIMRTIEGFNSENMGK